MKMVIITKYLPATNYLPPRMSVVAPGLKRVFLPWDDDETDEANHKAAAETYMNKCNWVGTPVMGWLGPNKGVVHVFP